jgi:hypothetical protein
VACNDDAGPGLDSSFIYGFFAAGQYRVQIASAGGAVTHDSSVRLEYELSVQGLSVMPGDKFTQPTAISLGGASSTIDLDWGYNDSSMDMLIEQCFDEASVATNRLGSRDYWYSFMLTDDSIITFDPAGSENQGGSELDTLLSVHRVNQSGLPATPEFLELAGCVDNSQVSVQPSLTLDLQPGEYFVRLAAADPLGVSGTFTYMLGTRVNPVRNGGFELGNDRAINSAPWVFKNKRGDKIDCAYPLPYDGACVLKLKGSANEAFKATQTLHIADIDFSVSTLIDVTASFKTTSAKTNVKVVLQLKFTGGGKQKVNALSLGAHTVADWTRNGAEGVALANSAVSRAKLVIINKSTGGVAYVDSVEVEFYTNPAGNRGGVLPLPLPAAGG